MFSRTSHIYIVCGYTDMRKSIDGLCAVIQDQLQMNPSGSSLFLFCGRRCDRSKGLLKEPDGYVLIYKRLTAQYGRYRWLRNESEVRDLSWKEFDWLMSGLDIDQPKAIRSSSMRSAKGDYLCSGELKGQLRFLINEVEVLCDIVESLPAEEELEEYLICDTSENNPSKPRQKRRTLEEALEGKPFTKKIR
ncbi:IS66 family insertion sequence element accessory protein TnpB [Bacillota bacterium HCP3S3_E9]